MWLIIRNISLKYEDDNLRNKEVLIKNMLLHQNFNLKSEASRIALYILRIVELKSK